MIFGSFGLDKKSLMAQPRRLLHFSCSSKDFKDFSIQELPQPDFTIKERRRTLLWEIYAAIILLVAQAWRRRLPHMRARKQASTGSKRASLVVMYKEKGGPASVVLDSSTLWSK